MTDTNSISRVCSLISFCNTSLSSYGSLGIQERYIFHPRTIDCALFAVFSNKLFRGPFLEVYGTEDNVILKIPFLFIWARVNAERCLCQSNSKTGDV